MTKIVDIYGTEHKITCIACAIQNKTIALPVERTAETDYFVAEQDFEWPIEGFLIIASRRHIKSVTDFTDEEQEDFITFLIKCRKAMKEKLGIEEVTIIQEEASTSSHFHVWLFPWLPWMTTHKKKISNIVEIMEIAKKQNSTPEELNKIKQANARLLEYFK